MAVTAPIVDPAQRFHVLYDRLCRRTDKLIAVIMAVQWIGAIVAAGIISPRTWQGTVSSLHPHITAAIFLGGLITLFPVGCALVNPGKPFTRHVIGACQLLMSGLLIDISGGRPETHFHIFGSLAFLALYLDWTVLITASLTTALYHGLMAIYAPASIFGTIIAPGSLFLEHVLWVIFFDVFLVASCTQSLKGLQEVASREAEQEVLVQEQKELLREQAILVHQAYHDSLTGLGNRMLLYKELDAKRTHPVEPETFALLALDLDRFKEVNDTLGHPVGDELLTQVAARIKAHIRAQDTLVRMGGDEFALILGDCRDVSYAEAIAQRIIDSLNQPFECAGHMVQIGVSIGICHNPSASKETPELFQHADLALYIVKKAGRNRFHVFNEGDAGEEELQTVA